MFRSPSICCFVAVGGFKFGFEFGGEVFSGGGGRKHKVRTRARREERNRRDNIILHELKDWSELSVTLFFFTYIVNREREEEGPLPPT